MYTSAELQTLRDADPGSVGTLPGIDVPTGNTDTAPLISYRSAPYLYDPVHNRVIVSQAGAVLSGINFGSATLDISANNVTVKDCTFSGTTGYYAVDTEAASGTTIENCSFVGPTYSTPLEAWITSINAITIKNNSFIDSPSDAVHIRAGVVTGNYFSGAGYETGAHADAIWVADTTGPVSVTDNFIDWTPNANAPASPNNAIRITEETAPVSNPVTVSGNYLLGGGYTVSDAISAADSHYLSVTNNYIGFGMYTHFYPGSTVNHSTDVIFDWSNPAYYSQAWSTYKAAGIPTANLVVSTGSSIVNSSSLPTTLYGGGFSGLHMYGGYYGSTSETNFVGGYGGQDMFLGEGANIVTDLTISRGVNYVANFDPAKDVIDLSRIDANLTTLGIPNNFTFIGTGAFTGAGGQVRYQQDTTNNVTDVYVALAGDTSPDMRIQLNGLLTLSAANFALTAAQSSADMTAGASLHVSRIAPTAGSAVGYSYTNVSGRPYSSYESIDRGWDGIAEVAADDLNLSSSANELDLYQGSLTIARGSATETIGATTSTGTSTFTLGYHSNEVVQAGATGLETFQFGANFGSETINGFIASGTNADAIQLETSSFSYLNSGMTQAQDLAAVLSHASSAGSGTTILDSHGDGLTLTGFSVATLATTTVASRFSFV